MHARCHSPKYASPTTWALDISLLNSISLEQYPYAVLGLETGMHKIHRNIKNVSRKQHKPPGKRSRYPDEVVALGPKRACVTKSATSGPSNFVSMPTEGFYGRMELDLEYEVHSPPAPKTVWVYNNKQSRHVRRRHAQELHWNCTVLLQLIYPYMAYCHLHLLCHHFIHFHTFSIRLHMPQQVRGTSGDMHMGGNASHSHHHHLQLPSCSCSTGFTWPLSMFPNVSSDGD